eukprot:CAMPEP_0171222682 /NCGR_PEP_ID=MMETSP0790-20130122/35388_1 /TAXON_ID=2925 /ORGANISM="Alexandrium catenella, Strain OF101" /LENGTH=766 /DNA_ID=CAMNT_0011688633 /DNA_START=39 /DNA_END=2339 /DNA_ORIENTATION=+
MDGMSGTENEDALPPARPSTEGRGEDPADAAGVDELRRQLGEKQREAQELERRIAAAEERAGTKSTAKALSIVIPMGGLGDSFAEAGFRFPRPLVNIVGRPVLMWLLDHLSIKPQDTVILVLPAIMERQFGISKMLSGHYPAHNVRVLTLPFETRGWAETLFAVVRQMSAQELRNRLVTLDCSTIFYGVDLLAKCRQLEHGVSASAFFDAESASKLWSSGHVPAQFSYVQLDSEGYITAVREKTVISSYANVGAYIFHSAKHFRSVAERLLETPDRAAQGGLYASDVISLMLEEKERFYGLRVEEGALAICATPMQLEHFIRRVSSGDVPASRKMRFCFDLDGTLVTEPRKPGDMSTCDPIAKAISIVRQLHQAGHTIIITTARGMSGGGVDTAIAAYGHSTFSLLKDLGIPYDEIHFGKPHADVYVDTRSLNAMADIERDLGWHVGPSHVHSQFEALDGAIDARGFNLVRAAGKEHVVKTSQHDALQGECHWYRSIPPSLADLFPKPLEVVDGPTAVEGDGFWMIRMTRVAGVTFSHLATSRLLMKAWIRRLVRELHRIHSQQPVPGTAAAAELKATNAELCYNYAAKVASRWKKHEALYTTLGEETGLDLRKMKDCTVGFLEEFEASERAQHAFYIHGDPVFSNVIRTADDGIALIDMRGELGGRLTTQGDVQYDLSKVYQSLCGYDFMMLDQAPDAATSEVFDGLRAVFWEEVQKLYPSVLHRDVRLITASHFFSMVPLHELRSRMARYLRASSSMLMVEGLM